LISLFYFFFFKGHLWFHIILTIHDFIFKKYITPRKFCNILNIYKSKPSLSKENKSKTKLEKKRKKNETQRISSNYYEFLYLKRGIMNLNCLMQISLLGLRHHICKMFFSSNKMVLQLINNCRILFFINIHPKLNVCIIILPNIVYFLKISKSWATWRFMTSLEASTLEEVVSHQNGRSWMFTPRTNNTHIMKNADKWRKQQWKKFTCNVIKGIFPLS
jgi:hypothetical protein